MAAETYTTIQGDAWDAIAYKVYGDVKYTGWLMQHNLPLLDTFVFGAGTVLQTPSVPEDSAPADAPIWRSSE
jgi:phage tail protein X